MSLETVKFLCSYDGFGYAINALTFTLFSYGLNRMFRSGR